MKAKSQAKWMKVSPRKARLVCNLIRGQNTTAALMLLKVMPQKSARFLEKILRSAVANAVNNYKLDPGNLKVAEVFVDQALIMKRMQPRARGRAFPIKKRSSHITIYVEEGK